MKSIFIALSMALSFSTFASSCPSRTASEGICTGARVISDNGLIGTVSGVFGTGDVMVKFDGYSSLNKWPVSRLARTIGCTSDSFCVEQNIISDNGLAGMIVGVYQDGQVSIKFNGYSTYNKWPTERLSRTKGCTEDGYCMEDVVISDNGLKGTIRAVDVNKSTVAVKFEGYSTFNQWPTARLAKSKGCSETDFCVNDIVISDNGLEGRVVAIYMDGEVSVKFNGYSTYNKWPTSRLAITEACKDRPSSRVRSPSEL